MPFEVVLIVHKVVCDVAALELEQPAVRVSPAQWKVEMIDEGHLLPPLLGDVGVQRQNHADVVTVGSQSGGEGAGHISKTASFYKGGNFRCRK